MSDIPADLRYSPDHLWVRFGTGGNTWVLQKIGYRRPER
jgi:glycine cleavage system H lipoate-binding protein